MTDAAKPNICCAVCGEPIFRTVRHQIWVHLYIKTLDFSHIARPR